MFSLHQLGKIVGKQIGRGFKIDIHAIESKLPDHQFRFGQGGGLQMQLQFFHRERAVAFVPFRIADEHITDGNRSGKKIDEDPGNFHLGSKSLRPDRLHSGLDNGSQ